MKVILLRDGKWQEYKKELLSWDQYYNFVAWIIEEVVLVAPKEIDGQNFYHRDIVGYAIDEKVIDWKFGRPDAYGMLRVNFIKERVNNLFCSWRSQSYGITPEKLRLQVREALGLKDVVHRD